MNPHEKILHPFKSLKYDRSAVAEEFTTLPALVVIIIGFAIFISIVSQDFEVFNQKQTIEQSYEDVEQLVDTATSHFGPLFQGQDTIELNKEQLDSRCQILSNSTHFLDWNFILRISSDEELYEFNNTLDNSSSDRLAMSKCIPIQIDAICVKQAELTIIAWRRSL